MRQDIRRFSYFSQDYIFLHPDIDNVIADLRYGKLPYDYNSLWGIKIDPKNKNQHAKFISLEILKIKTMKIFGIFLKEKFQTKIKKFQMLKHFLGLWEWG